VEQFIPPKKGKKHVLRVIRELLAFRPRHSGTDMTAALDYIGKVLTRKSVVFVISDFLAQNIRRPLSVANKRHDLVAISIHDPREREMPPAGLIEFEDAETGETLTLDTSSAAVRREFSAGAEKERESLKNMLRSLGVDHINLSTGEDYSGRLIRFFRERAHRY